MDLKELRNRLHSDEFGERIPVDQGDWKLLDGSIKREGESADGVPTIEIFDCEYYFAIHWEIGWHEQRAEAEGVSDVVRILDALDVGGEAMTQRLLDLRA